MTSKAGEDPSSLDAAVRGSLARVPSIALAARGPTAQNHHLARSVARLLRRFLISTLPSRSTPRTITV